MVLSSKLAKAVLSTQRKLNKYAVRSLMSTEPSELIPASSEEPLEGACTSFLTSKRLQSLNKTFVNTIRVCA